MRNAALIIGIGVSLLAGQASAQSVSYDYSKGTDFTRFRTYAWVPGTPVPDEFNHERVVSAVEEQLAAKGMRKAEPGAQPDVLVAYHANFERDLQIRANSSDWGPRFYGGNRTGTARVEELLTGTLIVEMLDVEAGAVAWRGIASREVDLEANPEKRTKNIRKTTEKLFRNYPPEK